MIVIRKGNPSYIALINIVIVIQESTLRHESCLTVTISVNLRVQLVHKARLGLGRGCAITGVRVSKIASCSMSSSSSKTTNTAMAAF